MPVLTALLLLTVSYASAATSQAPDWSYWSDKAERWIEVPGSAIDAQALGISRGAQRVLQAGHEMVGDEIVIRGSCWDYIEGVFQRAGVAKRDRQNVFWGKEKGPYADLDLIRSGDWLYTVTDLAKIDPELPAGSPPEYATHSVIFLGWLDREEGKALVIDYPGEGARVPGRYREYWLVRNEVGGVFAIVRAR